MIGGKAGKLAQDETHAQFFFPSELIKSLDLDINLKISVLYNRNRISVAGQICTQRLCISSLDLMHIKEQVRATFLTQKSLHVILTYFSMFCFLFGDIAVRHT